MFNLFGGNEEKEAINTENSNFHNLVGEHGNKLEDLVSKGPSLVRYYMEGCGFCKLMNPEWESLINNLQGKNIVIVDVEQSALENVPEKLKLNIHGFPTIVSYNNGSDRIDFENDRTEKNIKAWLEENQRLSVISGGKKKRKQTKRRNVKKTKRNIRKTKYNKKARKSNKNKPTRRNKLVRK